jgi:hypothetical protein
VYHLIEFVSDRWVDMESSSQHPLERVLLRAGTRVRVQVRPHVVETADGPQETADLFFADGTVTRGVPFSAFSFVE